MQNQYWPCNAKRGLLILLFVPLAFDPSFSQAVYSRQIKLANAAYQGQSYVKAALLFRHAFSTCPDSVKALDVFGSARAWAAAGKADSAIVQLEVAATDYKFTKYGMLMATPVFMPLHQRIEWPAIVTMVNQNMRAAYTPIERELQQIKDDDQKYRLQADSIQKADGRNTSTFAAVSHRMNVQDSLNLIKVKAILDTTGWPSYNEIGDLYAALFLVIQHADLSTQVKYLPMILRAENNGDVDPESVATLQDRILVRQGKKQRYGSQLNFNFATHKYTVFPIEDEVHVNERRAAKGMGPLQDYLKQWGIVYTPVK